MTRISDHARITRDHRLMPHRLKGFGDTAEIAHTIVDDRNHIQFLQNAEKVRQLRSQLIEILNVPLRVRLRF